MVYHRRKDVVRGSLYSNDPILTYTHTHILSLTYTLALVDNLTANVTITTAGNLAGNRSFDRSKTKPRLNCNKRDNPRKDL
ncbi:hypothetical protein BC939DRAFT_460585 [Gamsiella multidivaricata]|uniref:uncharacterized protein n=1 Tax=Gamsiella multidivaricata TaxID=101098 RepID=UPI00221F0149|nr:uncharacterized protein BC939DRAFT_460585 [Gamsiella multidivaricata]KAI7819215.1 hypothetical protein BC939DRAFT_460585 [Gamsiella multidivaricata]